MLLSRSTQQQHAKDWRGSKFDYFYLINFNCFKEHPCIWLRLMEKEVIFIYKLQAIQYFRDGLLAYRSRIQYKCHGSS